MLYLYKMVANRTETNGPHFTNLKKSLENLGLLFLKQVNELLVNAVN